MAPIPGAVVVTGFIGPSDSGDTYAVTDPIYQKGGYQTVANVGARTAITAARRAVGMLVYQVDTTEYWTLIGGITDGNWVDLGVWPVGTVSEYRAVANAAGRTGIPAGQRVVGMMVYQIDTTELWTLMGGIGDGSWNLFAINPLNLPPSTDIPGFNGTGVGGANPGTAVWNPEDLQAWQMQWCWQSILDVSDVWPFQTQGLIRWHSSGPLNSMYLRNDHPNLCCEGDAIGSPPNAIYFHVPPDESLFFNYPIMFQLQGIGVHAPNNTDFLNTAFQIGHGEQGQNPGTDESIRFVKQSFSNKLWAEVNNTATGGHTFKVDTGITMTNNTTYKLAIVIVPNAADFYVNDVLKVTITAADAGFWPAAAGRYKWFGWFDFQEVTGAVKVIYKLPFLIGDSLAVA